MKNFTEGWKNEYEVSESTCPIDDTVTITVLYNGYYVSVVTHFIVVEGVTFIAMMQHCVLCV